KLTETCSDLRFLVGKRIVQHPHAALVAMAQLQAFHSPVVIRLPVLQLMKVFVHHRDEPWGTRFTLSIFRFADHDDGGWTECGKGRQESGRKLARTRIEI